MPAPPDCKCAQQVYAMEPWAPCPACAARESAKPLAVSGKPLTPEGEAWLKRGVELACFCPSPGAGSSMECLMLITGAPLSASQCPCFCHTWEVEH